MIFSEESVIMGWDVPSKAWLPLLVAGLVGGTPQSNYDLQALSVEYEGAGLPEFGTLNGTVTELGKNISVIPQNINVVALLTLLIVYSNLRKISVLNDSHA